MPSMISRVRTRLPACVVRMRSVLRFMPEATRRWIVHTCVQRNPWRCSRASRADRRRGIQLAARQRGAVGERLELRPLHGGMHADHVPVLRKGTACTCRTHWPSSTATRVSFWTISATSNTNEMRWRCSLPCWHRDQHNPELSDAGVEWVTITAPHHPLVGQSFPVVARRTRDGEPHLVIRRSNGASQLLPSRWTAIHSAETKPEVAVALTPGSLRALLSMVAALRQNAEVADGPSAPAGTLEHVQPPNPAPPGRRLDRTARQIPPGSARASERRER
jgi:hypothetical protein